MLEVNDFGTGKILEAVVSRPLGVGVHLSAQRTKLQQHAPIRSCAHSSHGQ